MRYVLLPMLAGLLLLAFPGPDVPWAAKGAAIKKCRDTSGRWHYGDTAAAACGNAKVIVIDQHGNTRQEIAPAPSEEELRARETERAEQDRAREQAKRDELLLGTYAHEADILYVRDRRLAQIEATIKASEDTLAPLRATLERLEKQQVEEQARDGRVSAQTEKALQQTRAQIAKHEAAIDRRRDEQEAVRAQAQRDLERYRALKAGGAAGAAR
jgi:chromosome segregation ATPase